MCEEKEFRPGLLVKFKKYLYFCDANNVKDGENDSK